MSGYYGGNQYGGPPPQDGQQGYYGGAPPQGYPPQDQYGQQQQGYYPPQQVSCTNQPVVYCERRQNGIARGQGVSWDGM